jgi:23S rRNA (guanosine2251-2'-O)-methyltransferase
MADERIYGVHPVAERLATRPESIERIYTTRQRRPALGRLLKEARIHAVPVSYLSPEALAARVGRRAVHQGVVAEVAQIPYHPLASLVDGCSDDPDAILLWLDRVVDPRNAGAVIRSATAVGVRGVILSAEGTAGLGPGAAKASAGAVERMPVARAAAPGPTIEELRKRGFLVLGLDPKGSTSWDEVNLLGRLLIVAGGEQRGLRPGISRFCDRRVAIPLAPEVDSLNVAVSVGVLLFEALRQRRLPGGGGLERSESR